MHDIGKIGVREAVLQKPARLADEEYRHIMQHTVAEALEEIRRGAGTQWDGAVVDAFLVVCRDAGQLPLPTPAVVRRRVPQRVAAGAIASPPR